MAMVAIVLETPCWKSKPLVKVALYSHRKWLNGNKAVAHAASDTFARRLHGMIPVEP